MHVVEYNACIMTVIAQPPEPIVAPQVTVRGLDMATYRALKQQAGSQGMSLNALAVKTLRQTAGTVAMSGRKARVETTLRRYRVPDSEAAAAAQALARHDELDRAKERQDWEARGNSSF